ncbi:methyltransferase domain-containing protein [Dyella choica]|uniref:Methyltransferase domain-containing protein n=1 Tax=Dyella choica TaxID=1927959 RepID=A0A432M556_9GAMM|nr:methyltransferase domain-containing protein [Dyella choica]RUL74942.1 methyltransferase domain-containing protein [Dyella choica]
MDTGLQQRLDEMLQDQSWREPHQLGRRIDMQEQWERAFVHAGDCLEPSLQKRGEALMIELEATNRRLYDVIRADIRHGQGANSLLQWAAAMPRHGDEESYDLLDALVSGVLDLAEPGDVPELGAEMVFYQPTPARHIFDFIARASIGDQDTVIDLGSGLGHVTLLTAVCTPARCLGIELQAAYVASARQCAQALNLRNAAFIEQDVRLARLSEGTVFYLYTPFTGTILRAVLDMLKHEAEGRGIRLCTLGPCTEILAREPWLMMEAVSHRGSVALFRSR